MSRFSHGFSFGRPSNSRPGAQAHSRPDVLGVAEVDSGFASGDRPPTQTSKWVPSFFANLLLESRNAKLALGGAPVFLGRTAASFSEPSGSGDALGVTHPQTPGASPHSPLRQAERGDLRGPLENLACQGLRPWIPNASGRGEGCGGSHCQRTRQSDSVADT